MLQFAELMEKRMEINAWLSVIKSKLIIVESVNKLTANSLDVEQIMSLYVVNKE